MTTDLKKQLKSFKKEVKHFRKISQTDYDEGIKKAKELIKRAEKFSNYSEIEKQTKFKDELIRTKEALNMYIINITNIQKFNNKWKK